MKKQITVVALFMLLIGGSAGAAPPFNSLVVFGDSLSDVGDSPSAVTSLYKVLGGVCARPCPPYDDGRFSNGPVASEYLAEALFPGAVNTANFASYAVAGATTGNENSGNDIEPVFNLPGMQQEVNLYMSNSGSAADPNALYLLWGGANDYDINDSPVQAASNIGGYLNILATAGATHFLVPNLPDLGLTPAAQMDGEVAEAHAFTETFNTALAGELGSVNAAFPAVTIYQFDTFSLLNDVVQNPAGYGFTNVTDACISSIDCADPDSRFLYWDDSHPTTEAHAILGAAFASAVPEPSTTVMFIVGLLMLAWIADLRKRPAYAGRRVRT